MAYRRDVDPLTLSLPFEGRWLAQNSPARRVPSHGTEQFGMAHAIDFVHVGERGRSAPIGLGAFLGTEPPERFAGFGAPILAPCDGTVVAVHDGEPDHVARRSPLTLLPYMLTQATRVREGIAAVAGNYVTLEHHGRYVTLVHLQRGSLLVAPGDEVSDGAQLARCGNSGNSTEPHVHLQANDHPDMRRARAVPIRFRDYREWPRRGTPGDVELGVPASGAIVAAR